MAKGNSLGSWIDPERMEELLGLVRPGSLDRPSLPAAETLEKFDAGAAPGFVEKLLPEEIPERAFVKGIRPKLPAPEPRPPRAAPEPTPVETVDDQSTSQPRSINPLNLYFHSTAPTPEARAKAFVSWVRETSGAESAFVVDAYGTTIAAEPKADPVFLASLSNLADALGRGRDHFSRPDQSALHLELDDGQILCVVQAKWEVATIALGLIQRHPLDRDVAIRYRDELAKLAHKPRRRPRD